MRGRGDVGQGSGAMIWDCGGNMGQGCGAVIQGWDPGQWW